MCAPHDWKGADVHVMNIHDSILTLRAPDKLACYPNTVCIPGTSTSTRYQVQGTRYKWYALGTRPKKSSSQALYDTTPSTTYDIGKSRILEVKGASFGSIICELTNDAVGSNHIVRSLSRG
jgi:hypothetical protein